MGRTARMGVHKQVKGGAVSQEEVEEEEQEEDEAVGRQEGRKLTGSSRAGSGKVAGQLELGVSLGRGGDSARERRGQQYGGDRGGRNTEAYKRGGWAAGQRISSGEDRWKTLREGKCRRLRRR